MCQGGRLYGFQNDDLRSNQAGFRNIMFQRVVVGSSCHHVLSSELNVAQFHYKIVM